MIKILIVVLLVMGAKWIFGCDCPSDERLEVEMIEKRCLEDYSFYDCSNNPTSFYASKECSRIKKCLENPE